MFYRNIYSLILRKQSKTRRQQRSDPKYTKNVEGTGSIVFTKTSKSRRMEKKMIFYYFVKQFFKTIYQ